MLLYTDKPRVLLIIFINFTPLSVSLGLMMCEKLKALDFVSIRISHVDESVALVFGLILENLSRVLSFLSLDVMWLHISDVPFGLSVCRHSRVNYVLRRDFLENAHQFKLETIATRIIRNLKISSSLKFQTGSFMFVYLLMSWPYNDAATLYSTQHAENFCVVH